MKIRLSNYGLAKKDFIRIIPDITKTNGSFAKIGSWIIFVFMSAMVIVSSISKSLQPLFYVYLSLSIAFLIISALSFLKFFPKYGTAILYLECAAMYFFGIMAALSHPAAKSTQIFLFLVLLPIAFGDRFYRMIICSTCAVIAYLLVLFLCLDESIWFIEALNAISLGFLGLVFHYVINHDRCAGYLARLEKEDIIDNDKLMQKKLLEYSISDALTGIFNRRKLFEDLDEVKNGKTPSPSGLLMIDIDRFKEVNDTYGHLIGDSYLRKFGALLKSKEADGNIVSYRYGGDEFMVLAYKKEEEDLLSLAESLRAEAKKIDVIKGLTVSISVGLINIDEGDRLYDDWLLKVDKSLYEAKKGGHDKVVAYKG